MVRSTSLSADRGFVIYLVGMLAGEAGGQIAFVAIGWQVYLISHRPFDLGLVGLAMFLPALVLALASGVIADRFDRRTIVVAGRSAEAACNAGFLGLVLLHVGTVLPYLGIAFVIGAVRALTKPAEKTFLPNIVGPERFVNAQAAYMTGRELLVIGGPALGGLLLALAPAAAFSASVTFFVAAAAAFSIVPLRTAWVRPAERSSWTAAFAGLAFLRSRPVIAGAITLDLFAVMFGGATAMLPIYADAILHVGPVGLGWLRAAPSLGAVVVAAFIARNPPRRRVGALAFVAVLGFGIATVAFALSTTLWFSLLALAIMGAFDIIGGVVRNGLVQLNTPDAMRGRVIAIQAVFTTTSNELGAFESGTAAALIGTVPSVVAGGLLALAVALVCAWRFPALLHAQRFDQSNEPA